MSDLLYDVMTIGRCSMDLFSQNIGAPFTEIQGFDAHIGGSPTNIALAASRLGLRSVLLTAVAPDPVGDFVLAHLVSEGVETRYIPRKPGTRTGLSIVGVEPPSRFPLVFYRDNPADVQLNVDDVSVAPIAQTRGLLLSGTALSRSPCRDALLFAAEQARQAGVVVYLDLDLRPDQWTDARAFGLNMRQLLSLVDVVIGTEEESYTAFGAHPQIVFSGQSLQRDHLGEMEAAVRAFSRDGAHTVIIKRGARGASVFGAHQEAADVAGFPVHVVNTVGAGDAFAAGLLYGRSQGWDWRASVRMGNACGAIVVTRHGCAAAMPRLVEVHEFMAAYVDSGQ